MKRSTLLLLLVSFVAFGCKNGTELTTPDAEDAVVATAIKGQYIVVLDQGKGKFKLGESERIEGVRQTVIEANNLVPERILRKYDNALAGFTATLDPDELVKIQNDPYVKYVEQDRIVRFAPPCGTPKGGPCDGDGGGGGGEDPTQDTPYGITRVNGGTTYTGNNVAWVLDSGIDLDHPDLNVDASRGFNAFTSGKDGKSLDDGDGHGTHVAGTIAAIDNSFGVIGVAAGATVIPVKVLDSRGSGSYSGVIAGVDHVAANGSSGDVANMSLGGPPSPALDQAIINASNNGIRFTLAAGNESTDANNSSPARVNGSNIFTISSIDSNDNWSYFSNYGNPPVDYAAPGSGVKSTWKNGGYNTISGTSMAAPHAAGVLLLGNPTSSGTANGDPDGNPDPIISH